MIFGGKKVILRQFFRAFWWNCADVIVCCRGPIRPPNLKKIASATTGNDCIATIYGVGYKLESHNG
jgi:hypothetical protein